MTRATAIIALLLLGDGQSALAARYQIVPKQSRVVFHLFKGGVAAKLAHDHVIRAPQIRGTIVPAKTGEVLRLQIEVGLKELEIDAPHLRRAYGKKSMLSLSDRKKIASNLHSKDQLWTARYPTARFKATAEGPLPSDGKVRELAFRGELSLRGKKRPVRIKARVWLRGDHLAGKAQLSIKQSSFGYRPYRAGLGLIRVKDRMTVDIYLVARRQTAPTSP